MNYVHFLREIHVEVFHATIIITLEAFKTIILNNTRKFKK
jgi:hypothetical protein